MKKVLVILLLLIFSAQGAVVALGGGFLLAGERAYVADTAQAEPVAQFAESPDDKDLNVSSSIEEMSDYVALDPPLTQLSDRASRPPSASPVLSSIDLPRALPPPRG